MATNLHLYLTQCPHLTIDYYKFTLSFFFSFSKAYGDWYSLETAIDVKTCSLYMFSVSFLLVLTLVSCTALFVCELTVELVCLILIKFLLNMWTASQLLFQLCSQTITSVEHFLRCRCAEVQPALIKACQQNISWYLLVKDVAFIFKSILVLLHLIARLLHADIHVHKSNTADLWLPSESLNLSKTLIRVDLAAHMGRSHIRL